MLQSTLGDLPLSSERNQEPCTIFPVSERSNFRSTSDLQIGALSTVLHLAVLLVTIATVIATEQYQNKDEKEQNNT